MVAKLALSELGGKVSCNESVHHTSEREPVLRIDSRDVADFQETTWGGQHVQT